MENNTPLSSDEARYALEIIRGGNGFYGHDCSAYATAAWAMERGMISPDELRTALREGVAAVLATEQRTGYHPYWDEDGIRLISEPLKRGEQVVYAGHAIPASSPLE